MALLRLALCPETIIIRLCWLELFVKIHPFTGGRKVLEGNRPTCLILVVFLEAGLREDALPGCCFFGIPPVFWIKDEFTF